MPLLFIHLKGKFIKLDIERIHYVLSIEHHVKIVTDDGIFIPHLSLKQLEASLPQEQFARVNRGTLIALGKVLSFDKDEVVLPTGKFSFSDKYWKEFQQKVQILIHQERKKENQENQSTDGSEKFVDMQTNVYLLSLLSPAIALTPWAA